MISDIYIPTITLLMKYYEEQPFHNFVVNAFPPCTYDHLPKNVKFISIEYKHDEVIEAFLNMLFSDDSLEVEDLKEKGAEMESGFFHIKLESDEDYTRRTMFGLEFILQKLHESYSFIASLHLYLDESEIRFFNKMYTFESNREDEEDRPDNLNDYTHFLDSYFYDGVIPDHYANEVAKWLLIKGRI